MIIYVLHVDLCFPGMIFFHFKFVFVGTSHDNLGIYLTFYIKHGEVEINAFDLPACICLSATKF